MEDACAECADATAEEHVTELGDGGVSENFLMSVCTRPMGGGEERGGAADDGDDDHGGFGMSEENVRRATT